MAVSINSLKSKMLAPVALIVCGLVVSGLGDSSMLVFAKSNEGSTLGTIEARQEIERAYHISKQDREKLTGFKEVPVDDNGTMVIAGSMVNVAPVEKELPKGVTYDDLLKSIELGKVEESSANQYSISITDIALARKGLDEQAKQSVIVEKEEARLIGLKEEQEKRARIAKDSLTGAIKEVPNVRSEFKAFMDFEAIMTKSSDQYRLQHDGNAVTDSEGFRVYNGEYMVAVGSYYSNKIGTRLRVTLDSGKQFYAIVGDHKSDAHTDAKRQHRNGNVVEFIVDVDLIPSKCKTMGDMSFAPKASLIGKIAQIEVL